MRELIIIVENDIKRCKEMKKTKDLLELAIVIEEVIDKNKDKIKDLENLKKDNVWKYNKKDLDSLIEKLENFYDTLVSQYNDSIIRKELNNKESRIKKLKEDIQNDLYLDKHNKNELLNIVDALNIIYKENLPEDSKWLKIKVYIDYLNKCSYKLGKYILEGINIIL